MSFQEDLAHMRKVVSYCKRHLAQGVFLPVDFHLELIQTLLFCRIKDERDKEQRRDGADKVGQVTQELGT